MKVLVLGATGYVGSHVAAAFRRAGHEVWGVTRSPDKARLLERAEIRPVVGDMQRPDSYRKVAMESDVLIQAAQDRQHDTAALDELTVKTLIDAARSDGRMRTLIYTSGVWVYGDTRGGVADETWDLHPVRGVDWRPHVEQTVLGAQGVRTLVMRPGYVYGHVGRLTSDWFAGATVSPPMRAVGTGENHWPMVHADDLAEGYLRAAQSGLSGEIFNLTDGTTPTVREMVEAVKRAAGYPGEIEYVRVAEAARTMGPLAEALASDIMVDSSKASQLLGWHPRHHGFLAEVPTYLAAWQASQEEAAPRQMPRRKAA